MSVVLQQLGPVVAGSFSTGSFVKGWMLLTLITMVSCTASPAPHSQSTTDSTPQGPRAGKKTLTVGVSGGVQAMGVMSAPTTSGGWTSATDVHSSGLTTTDFNTRAPIGRLAERVPSLDEGTMSLGQD